MVLALLMGLGFFLKIKLSPNTIKVVPLKIGDISSAIYGSAQLKTDHSFDLKLGTTARIIEIKKSLGEKVKKGDVLVTFDTLPNFHSPIDGIVTALNFKSGENVFSQAVILSITQSKGFYLEMSLDQKSVRYVKARQKTRVSFDGYRDLKIEGQVRASYSHDGLFYSIIDLNNVDPSFLEGMSADVAIITEVRKNVLLAPLGAFKDGKILLLSDQGPYEMSVSTGIDDGNLVEVQSQRLREGDQAILRTSLPNFIPNKNLSNDGKPPFKNFSNKD